MKPKRLLPLTLLLPLAMLGGCGGGTVNVSFSANWYANTATTSLTDTSETLEYDITFQPSENRDYALSFGKGSFTSVLTDETYSYPDGGQERVYKLHSEQHITGKYALSGTEGEPFEATSVSDVWFLGVRDNLRPVKSEKEVHNFAPVALPTTEKMSEETHFKYTIVYNKECTEAEFTLDDLLTEEEGTTQKISVTPSRFVDNEEILFALRGVDPTVQTALNSIDPQTKRVVGLQMGTVPTAKTEAVKFMRNGVLVDATIDAYEIRLGYNSSYPGPTRILTYAARTGTGNNLYRNVLLRFVSPAMNDFGDFTYTLASATFNEK